MIRLLTTLAVVLALTTPAQALTIDGTNYSSPYLWRYSYDIDYYDNAIRVDVDVQLRGFTAPTALLNRWETGIESIWSTNRFTVPILFNVDWVTSGADQVVTIVNGTGRWNMLTWYTVGVGGWGDSYQEEVAAHEYGHMISMWDEYAGGAIDPVTHLINTGGLMETLAGPTLDAYYDPFLDWYESRDPVPTPEPSTVILLAAGLVAIAVRRRQAA